MLSTLISTKNHGQYLHDLIASILSDASPVTELWICDDGSTDQTPEILQSHAHRKGLRLFRNEQSMGWDRSVSRMFPHVTDPYVLFMSADDYFIPEKLSGLFRRMRDEDAYVGFGKYVIDEEGAITELAHPGWSARSMDGADDFMALMAFDHYAFFATTIFKRSALPRYGELATPIDPSLSEYVRPDGIGEFRANDWNLVLRMAVDYPDKFLFQDQFCACFRQVPGQLSSHDKYLGTGRAAYEAAILILKYLSFYPLRQKVLGSEKFHEALKSQFYWKISQIADDQKQGRNFRAIYLPVLKAAEAMIL